MPLITHRYYVLAQYTRSVRDSCCQELKALKKGATAYGPTIDARSARNLVRWLRLHTWDWKARRPITLEPVLSEANLLRAVSGLLGAGVSTAINEEKKSEVSETFTHSLQRTKSASLVALKRMAIEVKSVSPIENGEKITAKTKEDSLEVELTRVTDKATRMSVKAGEGLKADRATAEEVIQQTQRALKSDLSKNN